MFPVKHGMLRQLRKFCDLKCPAIKVVELDIDMSLYLPNPMYSQFKSSWLSSEQKSKEQSSLIEDYVGGGACILNKQAD